MIHLYADTLMIRATVDQQARVILPAEGPVPEGLKNHYRQVTVLVPASPNIFMGIDLDVQQDFTDKGGVGPNRTFMVPAIPGGQIIPFRLRPDQWLIAMAELGDAKITVICEYVEDF